MTEQDSKARGESISARFQRQYGKGPSDSLLVAAPPFPKNMMVELSNACNHACIFCTSPHMTRRIGRIEKDLLVRILGEARAEGVEEVGFYTTGEPFIHKDLATFTAAARDLGFRYIYISTNGALATPERVKPVIDAGMSSIKFSINAGSRETYRLVHGHDDWDKVLAHLRFISDYRKAAAPNLRLFVTFVVTNRTAHECELVPRACRAAGRRDRVPAGAQPERPDDKCEERARRRRRAGFQGRQHLSHAVQPAACEL